ncbi:hypothetical protein HYQ40_08860 [Aerococcaceae bacterium DSM 111021]|nr:hypothetical protein [Aerococcaceae bacterium DSM 111021]
MVLLKHDEILTFFDDFIHKLSNGETGIPVQTNYFLTKDSLSMLLFIDIFEDYIKIYRNKNKSEFLYLSFSRIKEIKKENNSLKFLQFSNNTSDNLRMELIFDELFSVRTYHNTLVKEVNYPIKYDSYDMLELFWMEEETIQKNESHHIVHYSRTIDEITIYFQFDILKNTVDIKVSEKDYILLSSTMNNVSSLRRDENMLIIYRKDKALAIISLKNKIHVTYTSELDYNI